MNVGLCTALLAAALGFGSYALQLPSRQGPPDIPGILADIKAHDTGQLAVSEEDGRFLRVLVTTSRAKRALEIGGASGYSAIWIGMGLRDTGGTLVTIEYDAARAKELAGNVKRAGLSDIVTVAAGRCVRAGAHARRIVRLRVPGRVEEGLQTLPGS